VLLLEAEVRSEHTLSHIYQIAAKMAEAGSLPDPSQTRVLKAEFKKRCIVVLKLTNPTVEFDIKKLPLKDQRNIITALGGVSGCEDCPKPAEQYHHWDHKLRCWSRQSYRASTPTSRLPETWHSARNASKRIRGAAPFADAGTRLPLAAAPATFRTPLIRVVIVRFIDSWIAVAVGPFGSTSFQSIMNQIRNIKSFTWTYFMLNGDI